MSDESRTSPLPFYRGATPVRGDLEAYIVSEFERVRRKRPIRVEVVYAPRETGVIIYLETVDEEDRRFAAELERSLSEVGEPAMVTPTAGSGIPTG